MKTSDQIRKDISRYEEAMENCARSGEFRKGKEWVNKRNIAVKALQAVEYGAGQEYMEDQLKQVQERFNQLYFNNPHLDHKGNQFKKRLHDRYEKAHGVDTLRDQIAFLNYLLDIDSN